MKECLREFPKKILKRSLEEYANKFLKQPLEKLIKISENESEP